MGKNSEGVWDSDQWGPWHQGDDEVPVECMTQEELDAAVARTAERMKRRKQAQGAALDYAAAPAPEPGPAAPQPAAAPKAEAPKAPHEMTREEFHRTAWTHGTNKAAAAGIDRKGFEHGEFAPPHQMARGISYGWSKAGLNALQVQQMKQAGLHTIPDERHGVVYFARKVLPGEQADAGYGQMKLLGKLPFMDAATDPHKAFVRRALAAGHPVPPEVLADYPDLRPPEATP